MPSIEGEIQKGAGEANLTLKLQLPELMKFFPEVKDCFPGTINVRLKEPLQALSPDFTSEPIKWLPERRAEEFSFTRVKFELVSEGKNDITDAWIYEAESSPHKADPSYIEIVAPYLTLGSSTACRIHLGG